MPLNKGIDPLGKTYRLERMGTGQQEGWIKPKDILCPVIVSVSLFGHLVLIVYMFGHVFGHVLICSVMSSSVCLM